MGNSLHQGNAKFIFFSCVFQKYLKVCLNFDTFKNTNTGKGKILGRIHHAIADGIRLVKNLGDIMLKTKDGNY